MNNNATSSTVILIIILTLASYLLYSRYYAKYLHVLPHLIITELLDDYQYFTDKKQGHRETS